MLGVLQVLGDKVRELRLANGWTQPELAVRAKISPTGLWKIENGRTASPAVGTVEKIARALGVPPSELTGEEFTDSYSAQQRELMRLVPSDLLPAFIDFTRGWVMQPDDDRALVVEFQRVLHLHRLGRVRTRLVRRSRTRVEVEG